MFERRPRERTIACSRIWATLLGQTAGGLLVTLQAATPAIAASSSSADFVEGPAGNASTLTQSDEKPSTKTTDAAPPAQAGDSAEFNEMAIDENAMSAPAAAGSGGDPLAFVHNISRDAALFGDMWGLRPALAKLGMTLTVQQTSEMMGNATGGTGRAVLYQGLTTATLQMDTQRAFGWNGGLFNASALWVGGGNLSTKTLQTLQTASGIEADPGLRLWELWYQQKLFSDKVDIKIGQQSLDQEFMVTQNGSYFVNTMFGWPMLPSANMPGGGPAYPLSALGVRVRTHLNDSLTLLTGVYNGSPVSSIDGDPQRNNAHGVNFLIGQGVLAIAELQYSYPSPNTLVEAGQSDPLARTYKIGFWYDSWKFASQQWADDGTLLADPNSSGNPQILRSNYAFYAVADQMIYRFPDDADRNINVFIRPMFTPIQDRNLISFSVNAGVTMHEPFYGRDDDTFGLGMGYTHVTSGARGSDMQTLVFNPGTYVPIRSGETYFEATYQYQPLAWLQIQPDIQYVIYPGAGLANPNNPTKRIGNELVFGLRLNAQL